jgi:uncharacterized protein YhbP (UPF0306 family)
MQARLERVHRLLRSETTMVLATVDEDLAPRCTPLFYWADDALRLYWFSSRASVHSRNCTRRPAAAAAVFAPARHWKEIRGAQLWGRVALVQDRELRQRIEHEYRERFGVGRVLAPAIQRAALYCFTPERVRYMANARRFGENFEISGASEGLPQSFGRQ